MTNLAPTTDLNPTHERKWLIVLVVFTLLVRVIFFLIYQPDISYDNMEIDSWLRIAERVVDGGGYSWVAPHISTAKRGPVMVYTLVALLWMFGKQSFPILVMNWLVDAGSAVVLYFTTREVFPNRLTAVIAVGIFALYGPEITFTFRAWSEPLFTLLLLGFNLALLRAIHNPDLWRFALAGFMLGLTILTRPFMQYYFVVVCILIAWALYGRWQQVLKSCIISAIVMVLTLTPWTVRNALVFGEFIPASSYSGWPIFESNHFLAMPDYTRSRTNVESATALLKVLEPRVGSTDDPARIFLHTALNGMSEVEVDDIAKHEAFKTICAYPGRYLVVSFLRLMRLWFNVGYGVPSSLQTYLVLATNASLLILAFLPFFVYKGPWIRRGLPLVILVGFNTAIYTASQALVRYSIPIVPFVITFAAYALVRLARLERYIPEGKTQSS